jgi:hypothetical protein
LTLLVASCGSILFGVAVVLLVAPRILSEPGGRALTLGLGIGLGLGLGAAAAFGWLALLGPLGSGYRMTELAVAIVIAGLTLWRRRSLLTRSIKNFQSPFVGPTAPVLRYSLAGLLCIAGLYFLAYYDANPHGRWDAWAIWNMRARFLFLSGNSWTVAFTEIPGLPHGDYPLLVPGAVLRLWTWMGEASTSAPALIGVMFFVAALFTIFGVVSFLRGPNQGMLATLALLGTYYFVQTGISQYVDVPLAFFVLATLACLALLDRFPRQTPPLAYLAGLSAGCAIWTKNEGLLFVSVLVVARVIQAFLNRGRPVAREFAGFVLGILPLLCIVAYFKLSVAPPNDIVYANMLQSSLTKLGTADRYWITAVLLPKHIITFSAAMPIVLAAYLWLSGRERRFPAREVLVTPVLVFALMLIGFFFVFILTPKDLEWHFRTACDRLILQLWPAVLMVCFLFAADPSSVGEIEDP